MLLATSNFINKQKYQLQINELLILESPKLDVKHPYYNAMLANYVDKYKNLEEMLLQNELIFNLKQLSEKTLPKLITTKEVAEKFR